MKKNLVGTVSVLHTETEAPLNLLCDDRDKLLSGSLSHAVLPFIVWLFGRFLTLFWQSRLAATEENATKFKKLSVS